MGINWAKDSRYRYIKESLLNNDNFSRYAVMKTAVKKTKNKKTRRLQLVTSCIAFARYATFLDVTPAIEIRPLLVRYM